MAVEAYFGAGDGGDSGRGVKDEIGGGRCSGERLVNHVVRSLGLGVQVAPAFYAGGEGRPEPAGEQQNQG